MGEDAQGLIEAAGKLSLTEDGAADGLGRREGEFVSGEPAQGRPYIDREMVGVKVGEPDPEQEAAAAARNAEGSAEALVNLMAGRQPLRPS